MDSIPTRSHKEIVQNPINHRQQLCILALGGILTQRSKEPPVLTRRVTLLKCLLDRLLRLLPLRDLLECICRDNSLQSFQLEVVSRGHQVVVVDDLDEGLDLASLCLTGLGHSAGDFRGVALDAGDQCVRVWVRFVSDVLGLDDHNLGVLSVSQFSKFNLHSQP